MGSGLSRYAAVFNGVEINSTFYRHHRPTTFERWANSVPDDFRFAVKLPREITHERRLREIGQVFKAFVGELAPLDGKLGPLLCQLPPNLTFDASDAEAALDTMRETFPGMLVLEPRHTSWATQSAQEVLKRYAVDRVLADPAPVWPASDFSEPPRYVRLHGAPRIYYSDYSAAEILSFRKRLSAEILVRFRQYGLRCRNKERAGNARRLRNHARVRGLKSCFSSWQKRSKT